MQKNKSFLIFFFFWVLSIIVLFSGCGGKLSGDTIISGAPDSPQKLYYSNLDTEGFIISWSPVSGASSYNLYINNKLTKKDIPINTFSVHGLTSNTEYKVQISSVNSTGESIFSKPFMITTSKPVAAPVEVVALSFTAITYNSFTLNWSATDRAESYNIYKDGVLYGKNILTTSISFSGMEALHEYSLRVSGVNSAGEGQLSETKKVTTLSPPPGLPDPPKNLKISDVTSKKLYLKWDKVDSAVSYNIYRQNSFYHLQSTSTTGLWIDSLEANTGYTFLIAAVNSVGEGNRSVPITTKTKLPAPLNLTGSVTNTVTLNWEPVYGATSYNIYRNQALFRTGITGTSYSTSDLTPNTHYQFEVTAVNSDGESDRSNLIELLTKLSPPGNVYVTNIIRSGCTVHWDSVIGAASYKIYVVYNGGHFEYNATGNYMPIGNLTPSTLYVLAVVGVISTGYEGMPSEAANFTTLANHKPVISNIATSGTSQEITITYDIADADTDECNITFEYSTDGGGSFTQSTDVTGSLSSVMPGTGEIFWTSEANITTNETNVMIQLTPADQFESGSPAQSGTFEVLNGTP